MCDRCGCSAPLTWYEHAETVSRVAEERDTLRTELTKAQEGLQDKSKEFAIYAQKMEAKVKELELRNEDLKGDKFLLQDKKKVAEVKVKELEARIRKQLQGIRVAKGWLHAPYTPEYAQIIKCYQVLEQILYEEEQALKEDV